MSATKTKRQPSVNQCVRNIIKQIEMEFITNKLAPKYRRGYLDARRRLYASIGEVAPRFKAEVKA